MAFSATNPTGKGKPRSDDGWLFGPWPDLLIGCGLAYVLSAPLLMLVAGVTGTTQWPALLVLIMVSGLNSPHYGATLVRTYEAREDRRKYALFCAHITLALLVLLFFSTRNVWLASLVITAYITWSPWHFSAQNYGLSMMFLHRRKVEVDAGTKRLFHASFAFSALLAMLALHSGPNVSVYVPQTLPLANTPVILHPPLPSGLAHAIFGVALAGYAGCLIAVGWRLRGRTRLRALGPALILVSTQALWFTVPSLLYYAGTPARNLVFAAIWISTAHSVQYLWISAYFGRRSQKPASVDRFLLKSFVAGAGLSGALFLLLGPQALGRTAADVGLAATIFAAINLHHFILDGAIWKLRDRRVAGVLLETREAEGSGSAGAHGRSWLRGLVWTAVGLAAVAQGARVYANQFLVNSERPDRIDRGVRILRWTGYETVGLQLSLGVRLTLAGEHDRAIALFRRSLELFPTAQAWAELGAAYQHRGEPERALAAFEEALALNPEFWGAHELRAEALLELDPAGSDPATRLEAIASLERAAQLRPERASIARRLARLQAEAGLREEALHTLDRALEHVGPERARALRKLRMELAGSAPRVERVERPPERGGGPG